MFSSDIGENIMKSYWAAVQQPESWIT